MLSLSKQLLVLSLVSFAVLYCYTTFQSSVSSDVQDATASPAASSATSFAGLAGLAISVFLSMTQSLNWTVRMASEIESQMVAVERVCNYANTVQEKPHYKHADPPAIGKGSSDSVGSNTLTISDSEGEDVTNALHDPSSNFPLSNRAVALQANAWSSRGEVNFDRVTLQYRGDTPAVLHNLSFVVNPGEKVGIVGRTGAGKSSLLVALLRLVELTSGHIFIDGRDISQLGLHTLRSRIAVICQEPVLFAGSLRDNLDPFEEHPVDVLLRSLASCGLQHLSLQTTLTENGSNFSVGERQLVCVARAIVNQQVRLVIMDEATASVDLETDSALQRTLRQCFREATVLIIAHRLHSIMDCDRVLVLDKGQVVEFDAPQALLSKGEGQSFFARLVKQYEQQEHDDQ